MAKRSRLAGLVAGLLALFPAVLVCRGNDAAAARPAKEIRVIYGNNGEGEIAPCG